MLPWSSGLPHQITAVSAFTLLTLGYFARGSGAGARPRPPGRFWIGQAEHLRLSRGLSRRARDVRGDDVCGVAVQGCSGPVISHCGSRIGARGGFLNIPQRDTGVQRGGDECVAEGVRARRAW